MLHVKIITMSEIDQLKAKLSEMQEELSSRNEDIDTYKQAFTDLNARLQTVMSYLSQNIESMKQLQKALVPTKNPSIPGFEFSTKFNSGSSAGGDYFDIFSLGDKSRFGIVVGTSSDYTTSALLLATLLGVSSKATYTLEPGQLLENIGRELSPQFGEKVKVDLFYGSFDRRNYVLSYSAVGGSCIFHQDYETGKVKLLTGASEALAHGFEAYPGTQELALGPRDRLVICSRGYVIEANEAGDKYGSPRLAADIMEASDRGAHELRNHLILKSSSFLNKKSFDYDRTLMVVEVMDKVIKLA